MEIAAEEAPWYKFLGAVLVAGFIGLSMQPLVSQQPMTRAEIRCVEALRNAKIGQHLVLINNQRPSVRTHRIERVDPRSDYMKVSGREQNVRFGRQCRKDVGVHIVAHKSLLSFIEQMQF